MKFAVTGNILYVFSSHPWKQTTTKKKLFRNLKMSKFHKRWVWSLYRVRARPAQRQQTISVDFTIIYHFLLWCDTITVQKSNQMPCDVFVHGPNCWAISAFDNRCSNVIKKLPWRSLSFKILFLAHRLTLSICYVINWTFSTAQQRSICCKDAESIILMS